jgi:hypothetical protein
VKNDYSILGMLSSIFFVTLTKVGVQLGSPET